MTPFDKMVELIREGSGCAIEVWHAEKIAQEIIEAISKPTMYMIASNGAESWSVQDAWAKCLNTLTVDHPTNHLEE